MTDYEIPDTSNDTCALTRIAKFSALHKITGPQGWCPAIPKQASLLRSESMSERDSICASEEKLEVERRPIPGWPGYEAGSDGSIWSTKRRGRFGKWDMAGGLRQMKVYRMPKGYLLAQLSKNGKYHWRLVHRLVLEAFVGACPPGLEACHWNGIKDDNRLANLRWDTRSANARDKERHGAVVCGERHPCHVLTNEQVIEMRRAYAAGEANQRELAEQYGYHIVNVGLIIRRRIWKHLP